MRRSLFCDTPCRSRRCEVGSRDRSVHQSTGGSFIDLARFVVATSAADVVMKPECQSVEIQRDAEDQADQDRNDDPRRPRAAALQPGGIADASKAHATHESMITTVTITGT